jgi:hypothetical protein
MLRPTGLGDQAQPAILASLTGLDANKISPNAFCTLGPGLAPLPGQLTADQIEVVRPRSRRR